MKSKGYCQITQLHKTEPPREEIVPAPAPGSALGAARSRLNEARSILADGPDWGPAQERVRGCELIVSRLEAGETDTLHSGEASVSAIGSAKLMAVTETRRALSGLLVEQATGLRNDINEQAEKLMMALYEAGAARAGALLEKYAPRHHGLSHERKCPACGGWWPRHAENCAIAEVTNMRTEPMNPKQPDDSDAEPAELLALDGVPSLCDNSYCEGCGNTKTYRGREASSFVYCSDCKKLIPRWMREAFETSSARPESTPNGATIWENRIAVTLRWMREAGAGEMRVNGTREKTPNGGADRPDESKPSTETK